MSNTLLDFLKELDEVIAERDALRQRVDELEAQRFNNRHKLGQGEVSRIREMRRAGYKVREIAESFDVNKTTVSRILRGEYHK